TWRRTLAGTADSAGRAAAARAGSWPRRGPGRLPDPAGAGGSAVPPPLLLPQNPPARAGMIDLYPRDPPERREDSIMFEETGLPYKVIPVDLGKEEQFAPSYAALNPNNKIPTIVDHDVPGAPLALFESGAILVHLAEKTGRFLPKEVRGRALTMQWLMFQM